MLSVVLLVPTLLLVREVLSPDSLSNYGLIKRSGRTLTQLLAHMPSSSAGYRGRIVVLNSVTPIVGCHPAPETGLAVRAVAVGLLHRARLHGA